MNHIHILTKCTKHLGDLRDSGVLCLGAMLSLLLLPPAYLAAQGGQVHYKKDDQPKDRAYWMQRLRPGTIPPPKAPPRAVGDQTKPSEPRSAPKIPLIKQYANALDLVVVGEVGSPKSEYGHFVLTRLELDRMITASLGSFSTEGLKEQVARSVEYKHAVALNAKLKDWCILKSIVIFAKRNRLQVSPAEVDAKLAQMDQEYGKELIGKELQQSGMLIGMTRKQIREDIAEGLLADKFIMAQINNRSPQDLEWIYRQSPARFATPLYVHTWQIFKKIDPSISKGEKKELRAEIYSLRKSIVGGTFFNKKGKDFKEVALKESDHPLTTERGGDMGWMSANGALSEEILKALFKQTKEGRIEPALEMGEVSKVVETTEGYYLFQITETRPATGLTFDKYARERVINEMILRFKKEMGPQIMASGLFPVVMNVSGFRAIGEPYKEKLKTRDLSPPALPPLEE